MKQLVQISLATATSVLMSAVALAQPSLEVQPPVPVAFRPFQPLPDGEIMMVKIAATADEKFDGELEITPTDDAEFRWSCGNPIQARLNDNLLRREADRYVVPVEVAPNGQKVFALRWRPEFRAFVEPGRCDMLITIRLLDKTGSIVSEQSEVPISLQTLPDTTLSIAGTSGTVNADRTFAFIDFGELETGEQAFILFGAQANTDVEFTIQSENGGELVSSDEDAHRIEYSAVFDGSPLSLASGQVVRRRPVSSLQGSRYRLDVMIGNVEGAYSGNYQDVITVEMIAQ